MWRFSAVQTAAFVSLLVVFCCVAACRGSPLNANRGQDSSNPELWLEDFIPKDPGYDEMLADSPHAAAEGPDPDRCPPAPDNRTARACLAPKCQTYSECLATGQICCPNGCVWSCVDAIPPPALVDWDTQPLSRSQSESAWLLPGPDEQQAALWCTTPEVNQKDEEDAIMCPRGYVCHIEELGDPEQGIPNMGKCRPAHPVLNDNKIFHISLPSELPSSSGCSLDSAMFRNGAIFKYQHHPCTCHNGIITCRVGHPPRRHKGRGAF